MRVRDIKRMWLQILHLKSGINSISDERMQQIYEDYLKSWHWVPYIRLKKGEAERASQKLAEFYDQQNVKHEGEKGSCNAITNSNQCESDVSDDSFDESLSSLKKRLLKKKYEQSIMSIDLTISDKSKQISQKAINDKNQPSNAHLSNNKMRKRGRLQIQIIDTPPPHLRSSKKPKHKNNAAKVFNSYLEFLPPNKFCLSPQINESVKFAHMQPVALNLTCTSKNTAVSNDIQMADEDAQVVDLTIPKTKLQPDYSPAELSPITQGDSNLFDGNYFNMSLQSPVEKLNINLDESFFEGLGIHDEPKSAPTLENTDECDISNKGLQENIFENDRVELISLLDGDGFAQIFDETPNSPYNGVNNAENEEIKSNIIDQEELDGKTINKLDTKIAETSVEFGALADLTLLENTPLENRLLENTPLELEAALMDPLVYDDDDADVISVATSWDLQDDDDDSIQSKHLTEKTEIKPTVETQCSMNAEIKSDINNLKNFRIPKLKNGHQSDGNSNSTISTVIDVELQPDATLTSRKELSLSNHQEEPKELPVLFGKQQKPQRNQQSRTQAAIQSAPTVGRIRPPSEQQTELAPIFAPPYRLPIVPDRQPLSNFDNGPTTVKYSTQNLFGVKCFRFLDGKCNNVNCNHNLNSVGDVQCSLSKFNGLSLKSAYKNVVRSYVLLQKYFPLFAIIFASRRMTSHIVQMVSDCRLYKKYCAPFLGHIYGALKQCGLSNNEACSIFMKILWIPNCAAQYPEMITEVLHILAAANWHEYRDKLHELFDKYRFPIPKDFMITIVNDVVQKRDPVLTEAAWELVLFNPINQNDETLISVLRILSNERNTLQQQVLPSFSSHLSNFRPMAQFSQPPIESTSYTMNTFRTDLTDPEPVTYDKSKLHFPM